MDGLVDRCTLKKVARTDDGFGTIGETLSVVKTSLPCRRTRWVSGSLDQQVSGVGSQEKWRFSTDPIAGLAEQDAQSAPIVYVIEFPVGSGVLYDVTFWEPRRDDVGTLDHLEFTAEKR